MFDLKTASIDLRKAAAALHIKSGTYEPVSSNRHIDAMSDDEVVAKVYNRNHKDGVEITAGDIRYASMYL